VFIDCDYLSQGTPISDPHYIGTFGIFGDHEGHGGKPAPKPSIVLDLTRAIKRVYGSATELAGGIRIQILPVPNKSAAGPGTAARGASKLRSSPPEPISGHRAMCMGRREWLIAGQA
jgi:tyrosinase